MNKQIALPPTLMYSVENAKELYRHKPDAITQYKQFTAVAEKDLITVYGKLSAMSDNDLGSYTDENNGGTSLPLVLKMPEKSVPIFMSFSQGGQSLGVVCDNGMLTVFNCDKSSIILRVEIGEPGEAIAVFPIEKTGQWGVVLYDSIMLVSPTETSKIPIGGELVGAFFSQKLDAMRVVSTDQKVIEIAPAKEGFSVFELFTLDIHRETTWKSCVFSPNGLHLAVIDENGSFCDVYSLETRERLSSFQSPHPTHRKEASEFLSAVFSLEGQHLWISNQQGTIDVYDIYSGTKLGRCFTQPDWSPGEKLSTATCMLPTPYNKLIFGAGEKVWSTQLTETL